jgi:hypothetical protein
MRHTAWFDLACDADSALHLNIRLTDSIERMANRCPIHIDLSRPCSGDLAPAPAGASRCHGDIIARQEEAPPEPSMLWKSHRVRSPFSRPGRTICSPSQARVRPGWSTNLAALNRNTKAEPEGPLSTETKETF